MGYWVKSSRSQSFIRDSAERQESQEEIPIRSCLVHLDYNQTPCTFHVPYHSKNRNVKLKSPNQIVQFEIRTSKSLVFKWSVFRSPLYKFSSNLFQESSGGHNEVLQTLVDDLTEREARLESSNRKLNQRILELESKLEEARGAQNFVAPRVPGSREELELKLAEANKKVYCLWPVQWGSETRLSRLLNGQKQIL